MKKTLLLRFCLLLLAGQPFGTVLAQPTAQEYVRPYSETFRYGSNLGYYANGWDDLDVARLVRQAGGGTLRPTLPADFLEQYGYDFRVNTFRTYVEQMGMGELTCFIEKPAPAHRETTTYPGCDEPSLLFANLYEPIWQPDGTVNEHNHFAYYVFRLVQHYGAYVRFWEVWNEPDFTNHDPDRWLERAPLPAELVNAKAPIYHYIRLLRITWEVVKRYRPEAYVTTGGIGYYQYLDAVLRYTDNPDQGKVTPQYPHTGGAYFDVLSFHCYPNYYLRTWDNALGGFAFSRHSDQAAQKVIAHKQGMEDVLARYGYDGLRFPTKHVILTETNVARRTADWRYGSDEMQRNFGMKVLVQAQKHGIRQVYMYNAGESTLPYTPEIPESDEYKLMGLYHDLTKHRPGTERKTLLGQGFHTTASLLQGYRYDEARTNALKLPANVDGGAFAKGGEYLYALWAKTQEDRNEHPHALYSFPAAWQMSQMERYDWDFASTKWTTRSPSQHIALTGYPSFFRAAAPDVLTGAAPAAPSPAIWSVFPNPTPDRVTVFLGSTLSESANLTLLDGTGRELNHFRTPAGSKERNIQIPLRNLPGGVYYLRLYTGQQVLVQKVVKY